MTRKLKTIAVEFLHHLPYSSVGVGAGLGILLGLEKMHWLGAPLIQFHVTHPLHLFLSALVTSAMFWKYENGVWKGVVIALLGTIPVCTLSDIVFPFAGARLFSTPLSFHLCLIEEPWLVLMATFCGIGAGFLLVRWMRHVTELAHMFHVLVSSLASLLYLRTFDVMLWESSLLSVFVITVAAVWIPCCLSDIVFPLAFTNETRPHEPHFH